MSATEALQASSSQAFRRASQRREGEGSVLRWGGLAGMLGGIVFISVFLIVGIFIGAEPTEPAGAVARFPDIRAARTLENGLYMVVLILWTAHTLALYRALRLTNPASAMLGSALGVVGLAVLAAGALPHAASVPISDLYHAPGATAADQASLAMVWQGAQAIFNALLVSGLVILPASIISLGVAMTGAPGFGKRVGVTSVALGVVAAVAAVALLVDPMSSIAVIGVVALIVFHLVVGWRLYRGSAEVGAQRA